MKIKDMIKENNRLQKQMTPANLKYYEDLVVYIRTSDADNYMSEELLLEKARELLDAQHEGETADKLFRKPPAEYGAELLEQLPKQKGIDGLRFGLMIPWVALTWFFLIQAVVGYVTMWTGGSIEKMTQIQVSTLIIISGGSYLLIRMTLNSAGKKAQSSEEGTLPKRQINVRTMAIYVVVVITILFGGFWFGDMLPVLTVTPLMSLLLFIIGLVGAKTFFARK